MLPLDFAARRPSAAMITWQWSSFDALSPADLYAILAARQAVFVVEQKCAFQDADALDQPALHLMGWDSRGVERFLVAYARLLPPGLRFAEPSIGRVLTTGSGRGRGLGKALMEEAVRKASELYPDKPIRISAQRYLEPFYSEFGFLPASAPYDEDGISHVDMVRPAR